MSLIIRVIVNALALWAAVLLIDGIEVTAQDTVGQILVYLAVGAIFGVVNAVIKPIVKTVGCLFYALTLGLIGLLVNALLLMLTNWIAGLFDLPFHIDGFWPAFWGAIVVTIVSWLLSMFLPDGNDD
ncbi:MULTISPECIES: phage holin family protein [Nocardiopsis]|uniref:Phage holin family protein n=2 Tax=Nocardiopsis TaxID=2013 RepID=A0A7X6RRZ9_9ACTN|nr:MULTISPECIES: phage holin family protein [Nocardiopsis]NKY99776.1 phage holin family protein [Nocardiopsis alborubida]QUX28009.1 phage holin family protein [Nocardiopsis akebiae]WDZ92349.1 phage holin family protein [Nocardiopsis sp. HUAS JQ3]